MSGEEEKSRPPREAFRAPRSSKSLPDLIGAFAFGGKFSSRNCLLQGPFSVPMRYCKGKDPDLEPQGPAWGQGWPSPGAAPREGFGAGIWSSFFLCYQFPSRPPARRLDRGAGSTLRRPRVGGGCQARMALCHPAAFSHLHPIPKPPGEGRATSQVGRGCGEHPRSSQEPPHSAPHPNATWTWTLRCLLREPPSSHRTFSNTYSPNA